MSPEAKTAKDVNIEYFGKHVGYSRQRMNAYFLRLPKNMFRSDHHC